MSRSQSTYRYVEAHPASVGYGPAQAVILRETDVVVGYVRRIQHPIERGCNWAVYDRGGDEVAVADQRGTAANFLAHASTTTDRSTREDAPHEGLTDAAETATWRGRSA